MSYNNNKLTGKPFTKHKHTKTNAKIEIPVQYPCVKLWRPPYARKLATGGKNALFGENKRFTAVLDYNT